MRKPDQERIYLARRAALMSRLTSVGVPSDRAEARIAGWEEYARAEGRQRLSAAFWLGAAEWVEMNRGLP